MGYQSKTWSLSDEVVAEIERRVLEMKARIGVGSPNRVLLEALASSYQASKTQESVGLWRGDGSDVPADYQKGTPPARELLVELDGEGE